MAKTGGSPRLQGREQVDLSDESGLTLPEMLIAILILSVALLGLVSMTVVNLQSLRNARDLQKATQIASTQLEDMRSETWAFVALDTADPDLSATTFEGEDIVTVPNGVIGHRSTVEDYSVTRYVTWANGEETEKRVTVLVTWDVGNRTRTTRESTLVSEARRGLPVPNFVINPEDRVEVGTEGEVVCFDHTLTNLGEQDSYSYIIYEEQVDGTLAAGTRQDRIVTEEGSEVFRQGYQFLGEGVNKGWFGWVRIGDPLQPMTDLTGDGIPDSPNPVARRADASIRACYTPKKDNPSGNISVRQAPVFHVRFFSAFDGTVYRDFTDELTVTSPQQTFYFHHPRTGGGSAKTNVSSPFTMDTTQPTSTDVTENYDRSSQDGWPGKRILAGNAIAWDYQFGSDADVNGTADITVWVSTSGALDNDAEDDEELTIDFTIQQLDTAQSLVSDIVTAPVTQVVPIGNGWNRVDVSLGVNDTAFSQNEYLRVQATCDAANGQPCHFHYDVDQYPSSLSVTVEGTL